MDLDALIRSQHGVCSTGSGVLSTAVLRGRDGCALSLRAAEYLHGVAPTAPPVITVLDLADVAGVEWREAVAVAARWVQKRRTTAESLAEALEGRARHRHRPILRVALGVVAEGAESLMEVSYVRRVEQPHGLPRASMQVRDGIIRRDFEYEAWLVVLEVDGVLGHEGEYVAKDRSRDRRAAGTRQGDTPGGVGRRRGAPCELAVDVHAALRARGYRGSLRAVCGHGARPAGSSPPDASGQGSDDIGVMAPISASGVEGRAVPDA